MPLFARIHLTPEQLAAMERERAIIFYPMLI